MSTITLTPGRPPALSKAPLIMIDGLAGRGKTTLLGTVGKGKKILVIDLEGGTSSFNNKTFAKLKDATSVDNIDVILLPYRGENAINDAAKLVWAIQQIFESIISNKNKEGYALVALDSLPELQQRFLDLDDSKDRRASYGKWSTAIYKIVQVAKAAPVPVVIISRPTVTENEVTGQREVTSALSPSAWRAVSGHVDQNGYYDVTVNKLTKKEERTLDFTMAQVYAAKTRSGLEVFTNPSMKDILDALGRNN